MNFKKITLLLSILFLISCGLKNKPKPPKGSELPKIEDHYKKKIK